MATPITWQNVHGSDPAAASRPLEAAQRSFSGMFDQLGGVLAQQQHVNEQNWQNTRNNNTQAYLDKVASFRTPEELATAQKSGVLNQLRAQFGPQIDTGAIRGAADQRLAQLYQQTTAANAYTDQKAERDARPFVDQYNTFMARGEFDKANAIVDNNVLPNEGKMALDLRNMRRQVAVEGQQDTRFGWDTQMQPLNLEGKRVDIAQGRQSIVESGARIADMAQRRELTKLEIEARREAKAMSKNAGVLQDKAYAEALKNSPYSAGSYDTAEGKKALMEHIKSTPEMDQADISDILYNLNRHFKDGITIGMDKGKPIKAPLPINVIADAVNESSDNFLAIGFSRRGDHVASLIRDRFGVDSDGYQRSDKMSKADTNTIQGMQFIKSLEAKRLDRLKSKGGASSADTAQPFYSEEELKEAKKLILQNAAKQ